MTHVPGVDQRRAGVARGVAAISAAVLVIGLAGCAASGTPAAGPVAGPSVGGSTTAGRTVISASTTGSGAAPVVAPTMPADANGVGLATDPAGPTVATTPAVAVRGLDTAEAAKKNLWDAWRDDDRPRALLAAVPGAVTALFVQPWSPEVENQGCVAISATTYRCAFVKRDTAWVVTVVGNTSQGYRTLRVDESTTESLSQIVPYVPDTTAPNAAGPNTTGPGSTGPGSTGAGSTGAGAARPTANVSPTLAAPSGAAAASATGGQTSTTLPAAADVAPTIATSAPPGTRATARPPKTTAPRRRTASTASAGPATTASSTPLASVAATAAPSGDGGAVPGRVAVNAPAATVAEENHP